MPAAGPWAHRVGNCQDQLWYSMGHPGKAPRGPKIQCQTPNNGTPPARHVPCCTSLQTRSPPPVSTQLQWLRKGREGGYGENSQLGSSWGGFRKVYLVQSPLIPLLQSAKSEIQEPQGPPKVQERKNVGLVCSTRSYSEHWWW